MSHRGTYSIKIEHKLTSYNTVKKTKTLFSLTIVDACTDQTELILTGPSYSRRDFVIGATSALVFNLPSISDTQSTSTPEQCGTYTIVYSLEANYKSVDIDDYPFIVYDDANAEVTFDPTDKNFGETLYRIKMTYSLTDYDVTVTKTLAEVNAINACVTGTTLKLSMHRLSPVPSPTSSVLVPQ